MKTVSQKVKEFGAKVKKDGCAGYYTYIGRNFKANFNSEEGVTKHWEVDLLSDDVDERVNEQFYDYNQYDTKAEVVWILLGLDQQIEEEKIK